VVRYANSYTCPCTVISKCWATFIAGTVYFKSTDGHHGQWRFSTIRLNLHVLEACCEHGGCIIVDATKRGKSFPVRCVRCPGLNHFMLLQPGDTCGCAACFQHATCMCTSRCGRPHVPIASLQDALAKTIPIWAAVINRAVAFHSAVAPRTPAHGAEAHTARSVQQSSDGNRCETQKAANPQRAHACTWDTSLHLPPWLPPSEVASIEVQVDRWARELISVCGGTVPDVALRLAKPVRPLWISQVGVLSCPIQGWDSVVIVLWRVMSLSHLHRDPMVHCRTV
jgi:tRNA A64-2'-O-ribosylphosphate transferase